MTSSYRNAAQHGMNKLLIMIVEDDEMVINYIDKILTGWGHLSVMARNGEEAVSLAGQARPDLALMDIDLPGGMDGIEASLILRETLDIPVIFLSAYDEDQLFQRAKLSRPIHYLIKPFKEQELKACIEIGMYVEQLERENRLTIERLTRVSSIVESSDDAIIGKSIEGTILSWNRGAEKIYGYSAAEAIGQNITCITTPERRGELLDMLTTITAGGTIDHNETVHRRKDGTVVHVLLTVSPITDSDGKVTGASSIARNITGYIRSREERDRQQAFLMQVMDTDMNLIFIKDRDDRYRMVNRALAEAYGMKKEVLIGLTDRELGAPPEQSEKYRSDDLMLLSSGGEINIPIEEFTWHNGEVHYYQTTKKLLLDDCGSPTLILGVSSDITARIAAEEEIVRLNRHIINLQEDERRRVAKDLHDGVSQVIQAAKLNFASYIQSPAENRECFDSGMHFIDQASRELREVYSNLYPSTLSDLGLASAVRQYLKHYLVGRGIEAAVFIDEDIILPDETLINVYRIIQEACSNIVRHSTASNMHIHLSVTPDGLFLEIQDNGAGFSSQGKSPGGGFGIINMKQRAKNLGGTFSIDTGPGGTTILIIIPMDGKDEKNDNLPG